MAYEYRVIPAPSKGIKAKGLKTAEDRFAYGIEQVMNDMGAEGWEYQRADTLPSIERSGLTGSTTNWRHLLVFRRLVLEPIAETSASEDESRTVLPPMVAAAAAIVRPPAPDAEQDAAEVGETEDAPAQSERRDGPSDVQI